VTAPQPIPFFSAVADFASGIDRDVVLAGGPAAQMGHRKTEAVPAGNDDVPILREGAAGCITVPRCVSSYKIAQPDVSTDRLHVRMPGFR
jgi:hypothetical protein